MCVDMYLLLGEWRPIELKFVFIRNVLSLCYCCYGAGVLVADAFALTAETPAGSATAGAGASTPMGQPAAVNIRSGGDIGDVQTDTDSSSKTAIEPHCLDAVASTQQVQLPPSEVRCSAPLTMNKLSFLQFPFWLQFIVSLLVLHTASITLQHLYLFVLQ